MRAMLVCLLVAGSTAPASAQDVDLALEAQLAEQERAELAYAHTLADVGVGLTLGGVITAGAGTAGILGGQSLAGGIGGGTFAGLGGVVALAGIPMWIVGSVRSTVLSTDPSDRSRIAWDFELAGITTTLLSIGVSLAGVALIIASFAVVASHRGAGAERTHETLAGVGGVLIPVGAFVALFIGTPLWAEGARF